jgi:hypothetical protein
VQKYLTICAMGLNESVFYIFIQIILNCILFINAFWKYFGKSSAKIYKKIHPAAESAGCTAIYGCDLFRNVKSSRLSGFFNKFRPANRTGYADFSLSFRNAQGIGAMGTFVVPMGLSVLHSVRGVMHPVPQPVKRAAKAFLNRAPPFQKTGVFLIPPADIF